MFKLWFVPEIFVFVRETSLKFDFWGRHAHGKMHVKIKNTDLLC